MNQQAEFLSLVKETKEYLLEKYPHLRKKKERIPFERQELKPPQPTPKATFLPQKEPVPQLIETEKEVSFEKKPLELKPKSALQEKDYGEIKELLKTHFPHLKLKSPPLPLQNTILILFHDESAEEKKLLANMAGALRDKAYLTELMEVKDFDIQQIQAKEAKVLIASKAIFLAYTPLKEIARRDASGALFFGSARAFPIPSLAHLVQNLDARREIWKRLIHILQS